MHSYLRNVALGSGIWYSVTMRSIRIQIAMNFSRFILIFNDRVTRQQPLRADQITMLEVRGAENDDDSTRSVFGALIQKQTVRVKLQKRSNGSLNTESCRSTGASSQDGGGTVAGGVGGKAATCGMGSEPGRPIKNRSLPA
jgi:hypothetical protein